MRARMSSYDFALIHTVRYLAPRHMRAISQTGNQLVAAFDTHDSVDVIDGFFPESSFFPSLNALFGISTYSPGRVTLSIMSVLSHRLICMTQ
jgi:UDP-N-acetyl-2-amino-2-deoxyglucuronate dehydrogenase